MKYEKDMIPHIHNYLVNEIDYSVIINEFDTGYGIADIVATKDSKNANYFQYENLKEVFLLSRIPTDQWIAISDIKEVTAYSIKYLKYNILKKFVDYGLVTNTGNLYKRSDPIREPINPILAIEAKLSKWKEALLQALRYKKYADYCYIALFEKYLKNVDVDLVNNSSIGLLIVSENGNVDQVLRSVKNKEKDKHYVLYANSILYNSRLN